LPTLMAAHPEEGIARAGILISLYALGVVVGAPTIAAIVTPYPRNRVMILLIAALLVGNLLTVVAPTFETAAITRFLSGLPHGAYFGMTTIVASEILGPSRRGWGVAMVMSGLTVANVVGVPGGTFLGQHLGWRAAYLVVVLVFVLALIGWLLFRSLVRHMRKVDMAAAARESAEQESDGAEGADDAASESDPAVAAPAGGESATGQAGPPAADKHTDQETGSGTAIGPDTERPR